MSSLNFWCCWVGHDAISRMVLVSSTLLPSQELLSLASATKRPKPTQSSGSDSSSESGSDDEVSHVPVTWGWLYYTRTSWLLCAWSTTTPITVGSHLPKLLLCNSSFSNCFALKFNLSAHFNCPDMFDCMQVASHWQFCEVLYQNLFVREKWDLYCCQKATMAGIFTNRYIDIARAIWPHVPSSSIT